MRTGFALSLLGVLGLICGGIVGVLADALTINCGEDCPDSPLLWGLGCLVAFPAIGYAIRRKTGGSARSTVCIAIALASISMLPAIMLYGYSVHYGGMRAGKPLHTDIEYSRMVISEKSMPVLGIADAERCAISHYARCDEQSIPARCESGFVQLPQQYWPLFKRLPAEDFGGFAQDADDKPFSVLGCRK